jgi:hypothetical protein
MVKKDYRLGLVGNTHAGLIGLKDIFEELKRHRGVMTRKDGVRVMVKDPKIFETLDNVSLLLKKQIVETGKLVHKLA